MLGLTLVFSFLLNSWQQRYGATNVEQFKTHIDGDSSWINSPIEGPLKPFVRDDNNEEWMIASTIDSHAMGVAYEYDSTESIQSQPVLKGSLLAAQTMQVESINQASLRVKDIDRLKISGSFSVSLIAAGELLGKQGFFQPSTPENCEGCASKGLVSFDFVTSINNLEGEIEVLVEMEKGGVTRKIPLAACGNPTVNIRLLGRNIH